MPELQTVESPTVAGFVNPKHNNRNRKRIEEEEKELEELMGTEKDAEKETVDASAEVKEEEPEENLSREEKSFKKRYGDLRRHASEKEKEFKDKLEALESRMSDERILPPTSDEDIQQWSEKYPDVAGIVETIAAKKAQEMFAKADIRLQELDDAQVEVTRAKAESKIKESHADFDELREADEFHSWVDEQPKWIRDALYENSDDPASVVRVIDLYKIDNGLTSNDKKTKRKAAASTVTKRSKTQVDVEDANNSILESQVAKMTAQEFEERSEEINKAIRSGKFVYDMSGKAR